MYYIIKLIYIYSLEISKQRMNLIDLILIVLFGSFSWKILEMYYYKADCQLYAGQLYPGEENLCWTDLDTYVWLC